MKGSFDLTHHLCTVLVVHEQAVHSQERRIPTVQERGYGVVQEVFCSRTPRVPPQSLESAHHAGGNQVPLIRGHVRQDIETHRKFEVARIEVHNVIGAVGGDVVEYLLRQGLRADR